MGDEYVELLFNTHRVLVCNYEIVLAMVVVMDV